MSTIDQSHGKIEENQTNAQEVECHSFWQVDSRVREFERAYEITQEKSESLVDNLAMLLELNDIELELVDAIEYKSQLMKSKIRK